MARYGKLGTQYFDDAGDPLISGKLYFYESGSTTVKATYADINETIANANPVVLTAAGRQPNIYFTGSARAILTKGDGTQIEVRDPIGEGIGGTVFASWDAQTAYPGQSIVIGSDGLYYRAIVASDNVAPPNIASWERIDFTFYYNANVTYAVGDVVITSDGARYVSRVASNLGNTPPTSAVEWKPSQVSGVTKVSPTSNVKLVAADTNKLFDADGTYTQTIDPATDLGSDWFVYYRNKGAGTITVDPDGAELINGLATLTIAAGESVFMQGDGSAFTAIVLESPALASVSAGIIIAAPGGETITSANAYSALVADAVYVLPDFTGFNNFGLMSLENSSAVPSSVETSDGWTINTTGLAATTTAAIAPTSTSTAHGTWGSVNVVEPPELATFTASGTAVLQSTVELTSGLVVLMYTVSTTGIFVVALNTTTNTFGTPVSLGTWGNGGTLGLYADTTSTFMAYYNGASLPEFRGGSVSGTAITLGGIATGSGGGMAVPLVQLASGSYFYTDGSQGQAVIQTGTTVATGAAVSLGAISGSVRCMKISTTTALVVAVASGASQELKAVVATISGLTVTAGTVVAHGDLINYTAGLDVASEFASGGPFLVACQNNTPTTTMNFFGITVSGTVPTIGAVLQRTDTNTTATYPNQYQYHNASIDAQQGLFPYDATNMLVGYGVQPFALSISGTTLTEGTGLTGIGASKAVTDATAGTTFYIRGSSTFDEVTVSSGTITSVSQVSSAPAHIASTTLTDKAVSYSGTWYSWALGFAGEPDRMITPSKWLWVNGAVFTLNGDIT